MFNLVSLGGQHQGVYGKAKDNFINISALLKKLKLKVCLVVSKDFFAIFFLDQ